MLVNILLTFFKKMTVTNSKIDAIQHLSFGTKLITTNGGRILMSRGCHMLRGVTIHADGGEIHIGNGVFLNENVKIVSHQKIILGRGCSVGPNVAIFDHDHNYRDINGGYKSSSIVIEDYVWIGANCVILRGTRIGKNCVIAAGSVIRTAVPEKSIAYCKQEIVTKSYDENEYDSKN